MADIFEQFQMKRFKKMKLRGNHGAFWMERRHHCSRVLMRVRWKEEWTKLEWVHRVAFMAQMRWTWLKFPGGHLEVSHLCHSKLCINQAHLVLETHKINQERIHCRVQGFCCKAHHILLHSYVLLQYNLYLFWIFIFIILRARALQKHHVLLVLNFLLMFFVKFCTFNHPFCFKRVDFFTFFMVF